MDIINLDDPKFYLNREVSLLRFNERVLAQAENEAIPLFERLRFLFICNRNMDEFFEIRVAALNQKFEFDAQRLTEDGQTIESLLQVINAMAVKLAQRQYDLLNKKLLPALGLENIHFLRRSQWSDKLTTWIKNYFRNEVLPILTPIGLDLAHPFPKLVNKSLNFVVSLDGKDAFGRDSGLAIIHAPRTLRRIIRIPKKICKDGDNFVFLSSLIHHHAGELFPGMTATGCYQFRLTRNSELFVDEEQIDDLLHAIKGQLTSTRYGDVVRLEVVQECPNDICEFLLHKFDIGAISLYKVNGPVNLNRLEVIMHMLEHTQLRYTQVSPKYPQGISTKDIFEQLQAKDILLHHPYESFRVVEDFIDQSAYDQDVLAIKITLYRTDASSKIIDSLVAASRAGKEVTVVIELRARFDEADNIALANRFQEAGILVVYGVLGYKTHAKMTLIVRREANKIRRYVHLSTGNYHSLKASQYVDFGLLSCEPELATDVHYVFQQLTGMGKAAKLKKIIHAPFTLLKSLLKLIQQEIDCAGAGKPAHIIAKVNAITDPQIIKALYAASNAGVKIDLLVRGVCCLRPGVAGVSQNISVRSIVGRYLEHARIYYFHNNKPNNIFLASADWMERNFYSRVEICFPVEDKSLADRVKKEGLMVYLADTIDCWLLQQSGDYKKCSVASQKSATSAQEGLIEQLMNISN